MVPSSRGRGGPARDRRRAFKVHLGQWRSRGGGGDVRGKNDFLNLSLRWVSLFLVFLAGEQYFFYVGTESGN